MKILSENNTDLKKICENLSQYYAITGIWEIHI